MPRVEDGLHQRFGNLIRNWIARRRFRQQDGLLLGLQIGHTRGAHREMPIELGALVGCQLVVTIARDEVDELPHVM